MKLSQEQLDIVLKSWGNCHSWIQEDSVFIPEVRYIDKEGTVKIAAIDKDERDALIDFVDALDTKVEFAVLNNGGLINIDNQQKKCLISKIYYKGAIDSVKILLADHEYNFSNDTYDNAISYSLTEANKKIHYLFDSFISNSRIIIPPAESQMDSIIKLINNAKTDKDWEDFKNVLKNVDINYIDHRGETILHKILKRDYAPVSVIRYMLSIGANPNIEDTPYKTTPIYYTDNPEIHKLLVKSNIDINHTDFYDWTAAQYKFSDKEILKIHLKAGLDTSLKNKSGRSIIFDVIQKGEPNQLEILKLLKSFGCDFKQQDDFGLTPLHLAIQLFNHEVIDFLLGIKDLINIKTTRQYEFLIRDTDTSVILNKNSTAKDLVVTIKNWYDNHKDDLDTDRVNRIKENIHISYRLVFDQVPLAKIRKELQEEKRGLQHKTQKKDNQVNLYSLLEKYEEGKPLIKKIKFHGTASILLFLVAIIGIPILIISLFINISVAIGIAIFSILCYSLAKLSNKILNNKKNKAIELINTKRKAEHDKTITTSL
ncbi:ankyrin repeat domain-containing protein [Aquimarina macrocephali]|uniref:ankyrin repeat domain-containing protein n=1 Tax=Aquimarina macrocephali TaxID=666563 RepID=UPI003F668C5D